MKIPRSLIRIIICLAVGLIAGAIGGASIGYLYEQLETESPIIPGHLAVGFVGLYLSAWGGTLGLIIGIFKLRKLWGTLWGLAAGLLFAFLWHLISMSPSARKSPDNALEETVVPTMAVIGFLLSSISQLLSPRPIRDIPAEDDWQNRILTP